MIETPFCEVGSILVTGFESNLQSPIARVLTAQHLASGGTVIALVDDESDGKEQTGAMTDALRSLDIDASALDRFHTFADTRKYRTSDELVAAIKKHRWFNDGPVLVLRDLGHDMTELLPGASWLSIAEEAALLLDTRILTVSHHGRSGIPAPNYEKFQADEVWQCVAGLNLTVTLTRRKPTDATVHLAGKVAAYGQIVFDTEEAKGFANV